MKRVDCLLLLTILSLLFTSVVSLANESAASNSSVTLVNLPDLGDDRLDLAIAKFRTIHESTLIVEKQLTEEQLVLELQKPNSDIDVFYVDSESAPRYIDVGLLVNLQQNTEIQETFSEWINIEKLVT